MNEQYQPVQYNPAPAPVFPNQQPVYVQNAGGDDFSDWDNVEEMSDFNLIPTATYKTALEKINQETVKSGDNIGKPRYNCQFTITDDKQKNRKIFIDMMPHSEISQKQVKALAIATGTPLQGNMLQVLTATMSKDFMANVGVLKNKNPNFSDSNTIWSFKQLQVQQAQAYVQQAQPPQPQRPAHVPPHATFANGVWWVQNPAVQGGWQQVG